MGDSPKLRVKYILSFTRNSFQCAPRCRPGSKPGSRCGHWTSPSPEPRGGAKCLTRRVEGLVVVLRLRVSPFQHQGPAVVTGPGLREVTLGSVPDSRQPRPFMGKVVTVFRTQSLQSQVGNSLLLKGASAVSIFGDDPDSGESSVEH